MMTVEVKKTSRIYEMVVNEVKEMISTGKLKQGEPLPPERRMIENFGVSRSSLREAFRVLESLGLIESIPGKGRFVRKSRKNDALTSEVPLEDEAILELVEARKIIEPLIASEAAKHASPGDLSKIRKLLNTTAEDVESLQHRAQCDYSFHLFLAEASHNFIFKNIVKMTFNLIMATHLRIYTLLDDKEVFLKEHHKIYDALVMRDAEKAFRLMEAHVTRVYLTLLDAIACESG